MEGTKHEKITLVILAYVIGFTSSMIAFGINQSGFFYNDTDAWDIDSTEQPVILDSLETNTTKIINNSSAAADSVVVTYKDGRLRVEGNGNDLLLSIRKDLVGDDTSNSFTEQGIHTADPYFAISPDQRYVYFCEQHTADDSCMSFVFDTKNAVIQFVSNQGQKLTTTVDVAKGAHWGEDDTLLIGDFQSLSLDTPWKVAVR